MNRSRLAAMGIAVALLAGACGSTPPSAEPAATGSVPSESAIPATASPAATEAPAATQAPQATTTPAPSASSEPAAIDAAAAFASLMRDPFFAANVAFEGSGRLGTVATTVSGSLDVSWRASHLVRTTTTGRSSSTVEVINVGGTRYTTTRGLWFDAGAARDEDLVRALVAADGTITETGMDTIGGRQLHHLVVTAPASLQAALAVTAKGVSGFTGTMDAWVDDEGTPVLVRLGAEWDQPDGKRTVHGSQVVDLTFTNVGGSIAISEPDQLWTWAKSKKYGYRMAYPADWQFEPAKKKYIDGYWGYDGDVVAAERFKSYGYSLNQVVSIITKSASKEIGGAKVKVTSNKPGKLGGMPARIVAYYGSYKKDKYWWVAYVAVKGPWVYWIDIRTEKKTTADDRAILAKFASTFSEK